MTAYDLHQHLWPESFVAALRARSRPPFLSGDELVTREGRFPARLDRHEPSVRLSELDRDGIGVAVLSLPPTLGLEDVEPDSRRELEETWAEGAAELASSSEGRFAWISPSRFRSGGVGISISASALLDLDTLAPVLDEAAAHDRFLFVHPDSGTAADPRRPPWWEWVSGYTRRMQDAYFAWLADGRTRWPGLRVLFAVLAGGAPFQLERLAHQGLDVRSALDPHTFFDVATYGRRAIELCIETFGVTQLVYGSDTPVLEAAQGLAAVRGFGDAVVQIVQTETPRLLLV